MTRNRTHTHGMETKGSRLTLECGTIKMDESRAAYPRYLSVALAKSQESVIYNSQKEQLRNLMTEGVFLESFCGRIYLG